MLLGVVSTLLSFLSISAVSFYSITSILNNKISNNIKVNTKQIKISIESSIRNLNNVSQQLSFYGNVGQLVNQYVDEENNYDKSRLIEEIREQLSIISYTNPDIGFRTYYFANEDKYEFNEFSVKPGRSFWDHPLLAKYYKIAYYGPHESITQNYDYYVLSAVRQVDIPDYDDIYVYIETNFKVTQDILESTSLVASTYTLLVDNDNTIVYTELPEDFTKGQALKISHVLTRDDKSVSSGYDNGYYWYAATSNQGWKVVSVISKDNYNSERNAWMKNMIIALIVVLVISMLLSFLLWRLIYRPMIKFKYEIQQVSHNRLEDTEHRTNIQEFDEILTQFQQMKRQIKKLIDEIVRDEKIRADLEIEKLRNQINPHFLMNTLNTVHWMAIMKDQMEIDRIILSLNRLLSYNLAKNGPITTLKQEMDAIKDYLTIQQVRYTFTFDILVEDKDDRDKIMLPRFIIQPLVENALFHGLKDGGHIQVDILVKDRLIIAVTDDGIGMEERVRRSLLSDGNTNEEKVGMGIGIDYVKATLRSQYKGDETFDIVSAANSGTTITISIPIEYVEEHHESISR